LARESGKKVGGDGCCIAFPKAQAIDIGGWDEEYRGYGKEDSDIRLRMHYSGLEKVSVFKKTTMIHLPHGILKEYHNNEFRMKFARRYYEKKRSGEIIANEGKLWGQM
jgi:predicted glycosyltransferase involved in capsule biosynthesis